MTTRTFKDALMDAEKRAVEDPASREFLSRIYAVTVYQKGSSTTLTLRGAQAEDIKQAAAVYQKGSSTILTLNKA
jgi:hypothetical protein